MSDLKLLRDRVVAKPIATQETSKGGIILSTKKDSFKRAEVVFFGPGKMDDKGACIEMPFKEGDVICYHNHSGVPIKLEDCEYVLLNESEIFGLIV